jgi:hypothetical protein
VKNGVTIQALLSGIADGGVPGQSDGWRKQYQQYDKGTSNRIHTILLEFESVARMRRRRVGDVRDKATVTQFVVAGQGIFGLAKSLLMAARLIPSRPFAMRDPLNDEDSRQH